MAALAKPLGIEMAINETRIIEKIEEFRVETANGIAAVNATIAGIKSDITHTSDRLERVSAKVDRLEEFKASKPELNAAEVRLEKTALEVKANAAFEAGRMSQEWTQRLDSISCEVKEVRDKVDDLNTIRWRIVGACLVIGALAGAFFAYAFHFLPR
jgi:hypothetical protein